MTVRSPLGERRISRLCRSLGRFKRRYDLAIAHKEDGRAVLDCILERKAPFSPDSVVGEFSGTLKAYGISTVTGDRYAGEWPAERFSAHGIRYEPAELNRSELYLAFLPLVNFGSRRLAR